jgi:branched-chain amino acid aminotransferase
MQVWLQDRLVEESAAVVSAFDHGLTVGDGAFETLKAEHGRLFALPDHVARLQRSAELMGLPTPDPDLVTHACRSVAAQPSPAALMRVRVTYTAGVGPLGSERGDSGTTLVVATSPVPPRAAVEQVSVSPWPRNERGALAGVKSTSYAENAMALAWAKERGSGEALLGNTQNMLCEGTGSNVFVVVDGRLRTPPLRSGCLAGITRALVLDWSEVAEEELPLSVLSEAQEVFITSSTRDVQPVSRVDEREIRAPGPVTESVMRAWERGSPGMYDQV